MLNGSTMPHSTLEIGILYKYHSVMILQVTYDT